MSKKKRKEKFPPLFFGMMFMLMGFGIMILGVFTINKALISKQWPTVTGVIMISEIGHHSTGSTGARSRGTAYSADVSYDYKVDAVLYSGEGISVSDGAGGVKSARRILRKYPRGKNVDVYYDPNNPEDSLLEPGIRVSHIFMVLFGLIFGFVGIYTFRGRMIEDAKFKQQL